MRPFVSLLRNNRNYRYTWMGQVVSEVGDHFNNVAVFGLVLAHTRSGMVVTGVMLARAIPAILAGPLAGVVLDRFDRKKVMIASDLIRAVVALCFILTVNRAGTWLVYLLSGLLMLASPDPRAELPSKAVLLGDQLTVFDLLVSARPSGRRRRPR